MSEYVCVCDIYCVRTSGGQAAGGNLFKNKMETYAVNLHRILSKIKFSWNFLHKMVWLQCYTCSNMIKVKIANNSQKIC